MMPNSLHLAYSVSPVACRGLHFYASSCLEQTLAGIIYNFVAGFKATNTNHPSARFYIQQIMSWFYKVLVEQDGNETGKGTSFSFKPCLICSTDECEQHIPCYDTQDGFVNIMALCIYILFMNVLDYETYRNPDQMLVRKTEVQLKQWKDWDINALTNEQRMACMYARGQALAMQGWLCNRVKNIHYRTPDIGGKEKDISIPTENFQLMMIRQYTRMILAYKLDADEANVGGAPCCTEELLRIQLAGACSGLYNSMIGKEVHDLPSFCPAPTSLKFPVISLVECNMLCGQYTPPSG